ncbi:MAG: ATP-grasp domain-containing protein [Acidobacteriota bacterium]|nr:ATP-grasp domain-containing protein [Acidobacteriota bacterium]
MANLLLVETNGRYYFDYLKELGHRLTLLTSSVNRCLSVVAFDRLSLVDDLILVEPFARDEVRRRVLERHARYPFDAVLSPSDARLVESAHLCEALSLPFLKPRLAVLLRNKYLTRRRLSEAGIPQPRYALASNVDELQYALDDIGYPAVVKPTNGWDSHNVVLVRDRVERRLAEAYFQKPLFADFGDPSVSPAIVEEFLDGPLISAESMSCKGNHVLLGVSQRLISPPPLCQEIGGWFPSTEVPVAAVNNYLITILDALNYEHGAAHTEMIVTSSGPRLVELNPRMPGGVIPRVLGFGLGINIYDAIVELQQGRMPTLPPALPADDPPRVIGMRWKVTRDSGRLKGIRWTKARPNEVLQCDVVPRLGDSIQPADLMPRRIAYVMAAGPDATQALASAEDYLSGLELDLERDADAVAAR